MSPLSLPPSREQLRSRGVARGSKLFGAQAEYAERHVAPVSEYCQGGVVTVQHDTWGYVGTIGFLDGYRHEGLGVMVLQGNAGVYQW